MKKKITSIIVSVILIMITSSCEDLLNLKPVSTLTSDSFWESEDDVRSANYGMYNMFRSTFDVKSVFWGEYRTGFFGEGLSGGTSWTELWDNNLNSTSVGVNWKEMYMLINDANLILKKTVDIEFDDDNDKDQVLGQAYFVRAYTYFQLVKIWGDVPLVTEGFESTDQDLQPARSPKADIFTQIKSDIDMAVSLLDESESVNYIGQAAANMLKTDVYLWTAKLEGGGDTDLETALVAVNNVLTSGYEFESNFENVFRDESSSEIIFSIFYSELEPGDGGTNGAAGRATPTQPLKIALPGLQVTPADLQAEVPTTAYPQWVDLSDYFINNILKPESVDSRTATTWQTRTSTTTAEVSWINKYLGEVVSETRLATSDLIIYRLAEAILFKAEIENALNHPDLALAELNQIAKRAYGVDNYYSGLNATEIDDAILDERILEFVFEGKSWFDILRFGQAFDRVPSLAGREGENAGNILLWPVAQDVISRNNKILQTDGY